MIMTSSIATRWKELSGSRNWAGLLNPIDIDLRRCLVNYGLFVGAIVDLFNDVTHKPNAMMKDFFTQACLVKGNKFKYQVTRFVYTASRLVNVESTWFGYVAVTTTEGVEYIGRRDILVAYRGTVTDDEWINNITGLIMAPASQLFGADTKARVHSGFLALYTGRDPHSNHNKVSVRKQVLDAVQDLVNKYGIKEELSITVTGHSLGAALATLTSMDIVANGYNKPKSNPNKVFMVTAFVFGAPRIGDHQLKEVFRSLSAGDHYHILRITNYLDPVPEVPPGPVYTHLGRELEVDTTRSSFLKGSDPITSHFMDMYNHGVAGMQQEGFRLDVELDVALINKYLMLLQTKYKVPPFWWKGKNRKYMVQEEDGFWKVVGWRPLKSNL